MSTPEPDLRTVVGVALRATVAGRAVVLAAERPTVPGWEFPGGKVEPGETPEQAAVREIAEELGCQIVLDSWLPEQVSIRSGLVLRVVWADLAAGEPEPREHRQLCWLAAEDPLWDDEDAWLPADRPFVRTVRDTVRAGQ